MGLLDEVNLQAQTRNLDFLIIGGLAVVFHGYSRETADIDLLVRRRDRQAWLELFSSLGYAVLRNRDNFAQLSPAQGGDWPVDLMLVQDPTFSEMFEAGRDVEMFGARVKIPLLDHLLALKLHALKHTHLGRHLKDLLDVEGLVRETN